MQDLLTHLQSHATDLTDENYSMNKVIADLEYHIASVKKGLEGMTYGSFVYEDDILKEKLRRIMDPKCNKNTQCGILDDKLTPSKATETDSLAEVLLRYAEEIKELRDRQDQNDVTIRAGKWTPEDDWENEINYTRSKMLQAALLLSLGSTLCAFGVLCYFVYIL